MGDIRSAPGSPAIGYAQSPSFPVPNSVRCRCSNSVSGGALGTTRFSSRGQCLSPPPVTPFTLSPHAAPVGDRPAPALHPPPDGGHRSRSSAKNATRCLPLLLTPHRVQQPRQDGQLRGRRPGHSGPVAVHLTRSGQLGARHLPSTSSSVGGWEYHRGVVTMNQGPLGQPWLSRDPHHSADEAGSVLRAWRVAAGRTQVDTAAALGLTQQHLSQMEKGQRPISLEQRRLMVNELGIAPEELGLTTSRSYRSVVLGEHDVRASRVRWRSERRWLDRHRWELARLAAQLSPAGHRVHRTSLIAAPAWQLSEPISLRSMAVTLDEGRQSTAVTGREPESELVRPLRAPRTRFDRYTSAIKHLSPRHCSSRGRATGCSTPRWVPPGSSSAWRRTSTSSTCRRLSGTNSRRSAWMWECPAPRQRWREGCRSGT